MRRIGPKTKLARRIGQALRDKDTKYLVKRNYPPGMHGQSRKRISEYGIQLLEKQKTKWIYELNERQFRRYIDQSVKNKALTSEILLQLLELRLDNVVYRLGFAASRAQARQLVTHRFFTVNGKKVNIPSFEVEVGDEIGLNPSKRNSKYILHREPILREFKPQDWLQFDTKNLTGKVLSRPTAENTGSNIQMEYIIEYYSR